MASLGTSHWTVTRTWLDSRVAIKRVSGSESVATTCHVSPDAPATRRSTCSHAGGRAGGKDGKDKPFKGVTAYNVYFGERTTALRKESPEMDRGEVAKMTGVEWKALTPDEKAPWDEKAVERNKVKRAAYDAAKANGTASTLGACIAGNDDDEDEEDE